MRVTVWQRMGWAYRVTAVLGLVCIVTTAALLEWFLYAAELSQASTRTLWLILIPPLTVGVALCWRNMIRCGACGPVWVALWLFPPPILLMCLPPEENPLLNYGLFERLYRSMRPMTYTFELNYASRDVILLWIVLGALMLSQVWVGVTAERQAPKKHRPRQPGASQYG